MVVKELCKWHVPAPLILLILGLKWSSNLMQSEVFLNCESWNPLDWSCYFSTKLPLRRMSSISLKLWPEQPKSRILFSRKNCWTKLLQKNNLPLRNTSLFDWRMDRWLSKLTKSTARKRWTWRRRLVFCLALVASINFQFSLLISLWRQVWIHHFRLALNTIRRMKKGAVMPIGMLCSSFSVMF